MNSKLYVGNLSFNTSEADLRDTFAPFGSVTDVYVASDRETGRPRGFAFVTFSNDTESKLAIEKLNGTELDGRQLTVNEAKPKEEMGGGGRTFNSPNRKAGAFQARGNRY
jgi:RNA recognition motif-containing protein